MPYPLFIQLIDEIPQPTSLTSALILIALGIPLRIFYSSDIIKNSIQFLR